MRRLLVRALLLVVFACLPGPGRAAERILRVAIAPGIESSEFTAKHDETNAAFLHQILEPLVAYRDDMQLAPVVAERFEIAADGLSYRFTIRAGLRFHNGAAVTSAEVKWSWDRYLTHDWGAYCRGSFDGSQGAYLRPSNVVAVEAPDPRTVIFRLAQPNALFLHQIASNYCISGILHPDSVRPDGSWDRPIGTGPFQMVSFEPQGGAVLRRFAGYLPRPGPASGLTGAKDVRIDELHFIAFPDRAPALQALAQRNVDMVLDISLSEYASLRGQQGVRLFTHERLAWQQLLVQTRTDPLLRDVRIRQAIALAIDRDAVARRTMLGLVRPNPSAIGRGSPWYSRAQARSLGYDPARARRLLRDAGYRGQQIAIQASRAPFRPYYDSRAPLYYDVAVVIAEMLRDVGIDAVVQELDWETQYRNYEANQYQLSVLFYSARSDPALMYGALIGQKTDHEWHQWEDPQAALWAAESAYVADPAGRQALFDRIHEKMIRSTPTIGLFNNLRIDAALDRVQGFRPFALGIPRFWGVSLRP